MSGISTAAVPRHLAAPIAAFLDHLSHERRLSDHTRASYARDLEALARFAGETSFDALGGPIIRRAVAALHAKGLSAKSIARMLSAWRTFYAWRIRYHGLRTNPTTGVRAPKAKKSLPKALSPDVAVQLLEHEADGALEMRDAAMFELLYSSGLRLAELISLDLGDARAMLAEGEVAVLGKGRKTRVVPVGAKARDALERWLAVRSRVADADIQALFVSVRGGRLSARMLQARLKRWTLVAGVHANVHPHVLRHSFASHVLQSSGDLRAVQEMLGHANIATTQIYTSLDFQHLAKVYDAAHPRAKKPAGRR